jgi:GNAT superfamily N-acetyltransferase
LVAECKRAIVGFGLLVCARPPTWPIDAATLPLPQIIDLFVVKAFRGRGIGTSILCYMEQLAFNAGFGRLYLCVYPLDGPKAYDLYLRLGYQPMQAEPYRDHWRFIDSDGNVHEGEGWAIDMVKAVA